MLRNAVLAAIFAVLATGVARASTLYNETATGDLSNNQAAPTPLTAATGVNSVIGSVGTGDTQDWIALTIPAGSSLTSLVLSSYTSTDAQGFMGVQAGSAFVGNPLTATPYLGYVHFGTGATNGGPAADVLGLNLLPLMGDNVVVAPGSQGFTTPLGAGTYTFLIQQLGAPTSYQFDFTTSAVPEPASLLLLAVGTAVLAFKRRSRTAR